MAKKKESKATKREARQRKKIREVRKDTQLHEEASVYYNLYLKHTGLSRSFIIWLSNVEGVPGEPEKRPPINAIFHYFIMIGKALKGKL